MHSPKLHKPNFFSNHQSFLSPQRQTQPINQSYMQNTHPYVKKSFLSPNIVKQTTLNISPTKIKQQVRPIVPDMVKPESKN